MLHWTYMKMYLRLYLLNPIFSYIQNIRISCQTCDYIHGSICYLTHQKDHNIYDKENSRHISFQKNLAWKNWFEVNDFSGDFSKTQCNNRDTYCVIDTFIHLSLFIFRNVRSSIFLFACYIFVILQTLNASIFQKCISLCAWLWNSIHYYSF